MTPLVWTSGDPRLATVRVLHGGGDGFVAALKRRAEGREDDRDHPETRRLLAAIQCIEAACAAHAHDVARVRSNHG